MLLSSGRCIHGTDTSLGQGYCLISEVRSRRPAEGGGLGDEEACSLARQARTAAGAALLSATTGSWLHPATSSMMSQAGCNKPCWPASTSGCKIWLSRHLGEWGNCHPGAWGLGEGQWADEGMEEGPSPRSEPEPGSWQEWGTSGPGLRTAGSAKLRAGA